MAFFLLSMLNWVWSINIINCSYMHFQSSKQSPIKVQHAWIAINVATNGFCCGQKISHRVQTYLFKDLGLRSNDDIFRNAWMRDGSRPFLGGSITATSEPTSQDKGSWWHVQSISWNSKKEVFFDLLEGQISQILNILAALYLWKE